METLPFPIPEGLPPRKHYERMVAALQHYAATGTTTLAHLAEPHMMNRSVQTLRVYCNAEGIIFPDWCPRRLRPKKPRVAKKKRRVSD